jgi:hypothetical protein
MDRKYWLRRSRSSLAMARSATGATARLIHFDLAGRYSIKAAAAAEPCKPALPIPANDACYYDELEQGPRYLAAQAREGAERHVHLAMATRYSVLRIDAAAKR